MLNVQCSTFNAQCSTCNTSHDWFSNVGVLVKDPSWWLHAKGTQYIDMSQRSIVLTSPTTGTLTFPLTPDFLHRDAATVEQWVCTRNA